MDAPKFSFCESVAANKWHIRILSEKGQRLGGGIDTPFLCREKKEQGWDIKSRVSTWDHVCPKCFEKFEKIAQENAPEKLYIERPLVTGDDGEEYIICWGCGAAWIKITELWCPLHGKTYDKCVCDKNPELELCDECAKAGGETIKGN